MYISEWANDQRSEITIKNILDMRSGLEPMCFDFVNQNLRYAKINQTLDLEVISFIQMISFQAALIGILLRAESFSLGTQQQRFI